MDATRLPSLAVAGALAACGGGGTDHPDAHTGDPNLLVGVFEIELFAPRAAYGTTPAREGYTQVLGAVYDAPQPTPVAWSAAATADGCTLYLPDPPFCSTPCGTDAVCVAADTCQPYATKQSVGTVHATGLTTTAGATELAMEPVVNNYQVPAGVTLAYPAFAEGTALALAADGSAFTDPFTLTASGIAELAFAPGEIALARDAGLGLGWTPGAIAGTTFGVRLDISHHGGSKGKIECVVPDTGTAQITPALLNQLLDLGVAGYPTIVVTRGLVTSTVISAGRVELRVTSEVELPVTVPGLESCTDDNQCAPPATCQDDLTCG